MNPIPGVILSFSPPSRGLMHIAFTLSAFTPNRWCSQKTLVQFLYASWQGTACYLTWLAGPWTGLHLPTMQCWPCCEFDGKYKRLSRLMHMGFRVEPFSPLNLWVLDLHALLCFLCIRNIPRIGVTVQPVDAQVEVHRSKLKKNRWPSTRHCIIWNLIHETQMTYSSKIVTYNSLLKSYM